MKVPRQARAARRSVSAPPADDDGEPAAWEPPSELRQPYPVAEPCPHCGEAKVYAEPRGTTRVCLGCGKRVTPPGVLAPYQRGAEVTRAAKSQRERDLEALDLAGRKGLMLGQLRSVADDDRLDSASLLKVEWFAEQVKAAASGARLDELAALFAEAGIRRRRWWQGQPAALTAVAVDDGDGPEDDQAAEPARILSAIVIPVAGSTPQRATWADALDARHWQLAPQGNGQCQITGPDGRRCPREIGGNPPVTDRHASYGWTCRPHYGELGVTINAINQSREHA